MAMVISYPAGKIGVIVLVIGDEPGRGLLSRAEPELCRYG